MLAREEFAHLPTRIEALPRLTKLLGGPEILIKRDDQTGLAFGGNKTRKLEYLLADALTQGAKMVLTTADLRRMGEGLHGRRTLAGSMSVPSSTSRLSALSNENERLAVECTSTARAVTIAIVRNATDTVQRLTTSSVWAIDKTAATKMITRS